MLGLLCIGGQVGFSDHIYIAETLKDFQLGPNLLESSFEGKFLNKENLENLGEKLDEIFVALFIKKRSLKVAGQEETQEYKNLSTVVEQLNTYMNSAESKITTSP